MASIRKHWLEAGTCIASTVALAVSLYALRAQRDLGHESATQTLIHDQYELCRVLDQMRVEYPEISHVLALPAQSGSDVWGNYYRFKDGVRRYLVDERTPTAGERAKLFLQEHAVALHVFDIYEQTLYQRSLADSSGDNERFGVLDMLVQYYEQRLLRNPRLRYHWENGGSDMMETDTRDRYGEQVLAGHPDEMSDERSPLDAAYLGEAAAQSAH